MNTIDENFEQHFAKYSNDIDAEYAFPIDLSDYKDFALEFYKLGLKVGAEQQKEQMVDKACEWLGNNYSAYDSDSHYDKELFVDEFKKAMKL